MKKQLFILAVLSIALFSCKNNNDDVETIVTVKLNPSFITMNEGNNEPMGTKSSDHQKMSSAVSIDSVVYAVQVYENDTPCYYGLFNDVSKMQLALTTSKTYKFKVSAYKAGTGKGLKSVTDTAGVNYFLPNKLPLKNKFIKGDFLKDIDLAGSIVLNGQVKDYLETDAFFSTKSVTIDKGTTNIDFTLLRMGFGINFNVDALTSGNMEIYLGNDTLKLNSTKTSAYTIRQFATTNTFANIHANADAFGDSIAITAKWTSTSGATVITAGKYKFLRNYQKTIDIQLNTVANAITLDSWKTIPTNGLVAWYPFSGNANDGSGYGKNGTVFGATLTTDRFGNPNCAYAFNGTSDYILTNYFGPTGSAERTISFWAQPTTTTSNSSVVIQTGGANTGTIGGTYFSITFNYNTATIMTDISDATKNYSNNSILNSWNFYTIVVPKMTSPQLTDVLMYLNGKLLTNFTYYNQTKYNINTGNLLPLNIGRTPNYSTTYGYQYFKGKIDDIGFWNRALSQDEITALYNAK